MTIKCNNSSSKAVNFIANGGNVHNILVFALQDGEYWFSIGNSYKTIEGAKRAAKKAMNAHGYTFNDAELKAIDVLSLI